MTTLVIVESPAKARKIQTYLGDKFKVMGSAGHIRDLPAGKAQIPEKIAKEPWAYLGVNPETFQAYYIIHPDKHKLVQDIKKAAKEADRVLYATDADREGEAIAWHLAQVLGDKNPVRMTFTEITKEAIQAALHTTRPLDMDLVRAQETRRIIDRLAGFAATRCIWNSVREKLSAGRIQAPALAILAQREMARMRFKPASFFIVKADADTSPRFRLTATHMRRKDSPHKPFARATDYTAEGTLKEDADVIELTEEQAQKLYDYILNHSARVSKIEQSQQSVSPQPPFTTATLQQAAARLGLNVAAVTQIAQKLYENGFITYIRTDSTTLSEEALEAARDAITKLYGAASLPDKPRQYATKNASAQEAHEAIRPAGHHFKAPTTSGLTGDELAVYDLIYRRTLASQMENAEYAKTVITAECGVLLFHASGRILLKPGYTVALTDDPADSNDDDAVTLPPLTEGQSLTLIPIRPEVTRSKPPPRYSETSLTKTLDAAGVGRPSTLPSLITTLNARGYTIPIGKNLAESAEGLLVAAYLAKYVPAFTEKTFTANMEAGLDQIAQGKLHPRDYLRDFWTNQLAVTFAQAPTKPPQLSIPHLSDVRLAATKAGPILRYAGREALISPAVIPAELTMKDVDAILNGTWEQKPSKSNATAKSTSSKSKSGNAKKPRSSSKSSSKPRKKTPKAP